METPAVRSPEVSVSEITSEEWKARKLSGYGYFSWLIDIILIAAMFAAMESIAISIIPGSPDQIQFWLSAQVILFIVMVKKIFDVRDPLNHYQTLIIKQS